MPTRLPPARAIQVLAAITVALVALSVFLLVWQMRRQALDEARVQTVSAAHMLREQTERTFESADQVLRGIQERMQTKYGKQLPLGGSAVRLLLGARVLAAPDVDLVALADGEGRIVNASRDDPHLVDSIAGAPYFRAFATGAADSLFVSGPRRAAGGDWTLELARPLSDGDGEFRGVAVLTMKVPKPDQVHGWSPLDHDRPMALYLTDGTLISSSPPREAMVGKPAPELGRTPPVAGASVRLVAAPAGDASANDFAIARAGAYPVLVSVTADPEPALAAWREKSVPIAAGALLVCAFTIGAAGVLSAHLKREVRLERALREATDRYQRTVDSLMDAIVGVDEAHNITMFNPAAERMFGLTAQEAIGHPVARLIPQRAWGDHTLHMQAFFGSPGAARGMASGVEVVGVRSDGTEFPIECTIARTVFHGEVEVTAVLRDVTQRRRAERELRETNQQLRALSSSLQDVREQERTRIAAELHDELGQQLTGLKLELSWLAARVKEGRGAKLENVDAMRHQLDATIVSVRRIATELRPRVLDDLGFGEAVAWQAAEFARRSGIEVDLDLAASDCVVEDAVATALFRIFQESLTNIARHSGATHASVELRLDATDKALVMRVEDDGRGIEARSGAGKGIGLVSMRERAMALGGRLSVSTRPGRGTSIEVVLPLEAEAGLSLLEAVA